MLFFETGKQHADGSRTRIWGTDTLQGRMFVQFVSLYYYEYFSEHIRQIKSSLGKRGSDDFRTKETIETDERLRSWMENTPLYLQLQWFDAIDEAKVSSELYSKLWNTEVNRETSFISKN